MSKALYSLGVLEGFVSTHEHVPQNVWNAINDIKHVLECDKTALNTEKNPVNKIRKIIDEELPDVEINDEEKIALHIAENGVTKVEKKPKRTSNMSPENKERAAQRMRDYQAKKKAEREAASQGEVGEEEELPGDTEEILENGVRANPDGSYSL